MRRFPGTLALGLIALAATGPAAAGAATQPNIIVIQTDDQALADLYETVTGKDGDAPVMPNTRALIAGHGVTFSRYYTSYPLSCPSRTTLLTGQYSHNHRVLANKYRVGSADLYCSAAGLVDHEKAIPARLMEVGYRTIHVGRFLNGYPSGTLESVPKGWVEWHTPVGERETFPGAAYFGYRLNDNGVLSNPFGDPSYASMDPSLYFTDVITQRAIESIDAGHLSRPFYLQFDHRAPHEDVQPPAGPQPAPRYADSLRGIKLPRGGSFNEKNVGDKPRYVRTHREFSPKDLSVLGSRYRRRMESLRSVDDSVATLIAALDARGILDKTYIFFASDNGFFRGEHRFLKGKTRHYEASTHVPLLLRGPGIPAAVESTELVANIDLAPTILELAGATPGKPVDGRSLLPFATNPALLSTRPILLEEFTRHKGREQLAGTAKANLGNYQAIISDRYKMVINSNGEKELYDLKSDPAEMRSLHRERRFRRILHFLSDQLRVLGACDGGACGLGVPAPPPPKKPGMSKKPTKPEKPGGGADQNRP